MSNKTSAQAIAICDEGIALDGPAAPPKAAVAASAPPFRVDEWSARQHVRSLSRKLRWPSVAISASSSSIPQEPRRFDPPQNLFDQLEHATTPIISPAKGQPTKGIRSRSTRTEGSQFIAWLVVLTGTLALAAGIGLIAWSLANEQMLHWNLAMGLALGGQGTLILGLVLVVTRLWRSSRFAAGNLQDVHARLGQLQHTADALTAMRSGGAPAFYADLVRGASPQMLLTNLKGQVDQLATRIGSSW
jgi:hypothetical protein